LKRCRDYAQITKRSVDVVLVEEALAKLGYDTLGLQHTDRELLRVIVEKFNGGPVGLSTLAAATAEDASTIEEVYEPYLIRSGLLERTPRGRTVTPRGYKHLSCEPHNDTTQDELFSK
jgi:Holliday junction DNA helicase RuvB